jgi:MFS family permease
MSARAVAALGFGQLVNWGVLYYAFAILLEPIESELGVPTWVVTGAFSLALLVSAVVAPAVGRWSDRGYAARMITLGGLAGALLLATLAIAPGVAILYAVWAALGVCMATALYEPAFAIVTRAHAAPDVRLRALATVTVFGGLASTLFLPLTALFVNAYGWRVATGLLAVFLVLSAILTALSLPSTSPAKVTRDAEADVRRPAAAHDGIAFLTTAFGTASLASASFIANLVPALGERGITPSTAAMLGGLFGVMQLPGRALMLGQRVTLSASSLLAISLALQALGLVVIAALSSPLAAAIGVMTFATGAGLTTVARPYVVHSSFAIEHGGDINGRIARAQQATRALGPIAASAAAGVTSQATVLLVLGGTLGVLACLALEIARAPEWWCVLSRRRASSRPNPGAVRARPNEDPR